MTVLLGNKFQQVAGVSELSMSAATVREALTQLARAYPALQSLLFNCEGELRRVARIYRNDQPAHAEEALQESDTLRLEIG